MNVMYPHVYFLFSNSDAVVTIVTPILDAFMSCCLCIIIVMNLPCDTFQIMKVIYA